LRDFLGLLAFLASLSLISQLMHHLLSLFPQIHIWIHNRDSCTIDAKLRVLKFIKQNKARKCMFMAVFFF